MEEIEKSATSLLAQAQEIWHLVMEGILSGLSLPHVIAVGVSLVVALLVHRWVRRLVLSVETRLMCGAVGGFYHASPIGQNADRDRGTDLQSDMDFLLRHRLVIF